MRTLDSEDRAAFSEFLGNVNGEVIKEIKGRFTALCDKGYTLGIVSGGDVELYGPDKDTLSAADILAEGWEGDYMRKRSGEFVVYLRDMIKYGGWSREMQEVLEQTIKELE